MTIRRFVQVPGPFNEEEWAKRGLSIVGRECIKTSYAQRGDLIVTEDGYRGLATEGFYTENTMRIYRAFSCSQGSSVLP